MSIQKFIAAAMLLFAIPASVAGAQPRVFNTGVDGSGVALSLGQIDPNWNWLEGQSAEPLAGSGSGAVTTYYPGGWLGPSSDARWISRTNSYNQPGATWTTYFQMFDLQNYDPNTVRITGSIGVDDAGALFLNGQAISVSFGAYDPFRQLTPFEITGGFRQGSNTLSVQVFNSACNCTNPSGLLIQDLVLTGSPTVVPEPSTFLLLLSGVAGVAVTSRRRKGQS